MRAHQKYFLSGGRSWVPSPLPQKCLPQRFHRTLATFEECPFESISFRYITLFFKGTYSVVSFHELMRVSLSEVVAE